MHIGGSQDPPEIKEDTIMAQVTMDSKEYLVLIDKERQLDVLKSRMVDEVEIKVDMEDSWGCGVHISYHTVIPQDTMDQIVERITDAVLAEPRAIARLVEDNTHFLNISSGSINSHWDDLPAEDEVDLLQNREFRTAWEAVKQEKEQEDENDEE